MSKRPHAGTPVKMLVDTCVWTDLAKEPTGQSLIRALADSVRADDIRLAVARTTLNGLAQNRAQLIEDIEQGISKARRRAERDPEKFKNPRNRRTVNKNVDEADHLFVNLGEQASRIVELIESLVAAGELYETTDAIKVRASQRGIEQKAPFHRQRNGTIDAILVETYADIVTQDRTAQRFAFVTHNAKDFSLPGNPKAPHPDIADLFANERSRYFITLGEALRSIRPEQFVDLEIEQEFKDQPRRRIADVETAEQEFFEKVWYRRHMLLRERVERGNIQIVESQTPAVERPRRSIPRDTWEAALLAAEAIETRYGRENLRPRSDFDWGMINGKLSAIRWVLGGEWDMLT
jgi:hypothetical protein